MIGPFSEIGIENKVQKKSSKIQKKKILSTPIPILKRAEIVIIFHIYFHGWYEYNTRNEPPFKIQQKFWRLMVV
jgi:hypothetical protein